MADERTRTDWKGRFDALSVNHDRIAQELAEAQKVADGQAEQLAAKNGEIEELKRAVQRARAEGLKGAAEFLLRAE